MVHILLRQKALALRRRGKSYGEIKSVLGTPKSTLSSWLKNLELPLHTKKILQEKSRAPRKQLMEFNRHRTKAIKIENKQIRGAAVREIKLLSKYELLLIGASLYWAEGYNRQDNVRSPSISFGNSDPNMIILFLRFLREVMQIPEEKLRPFVQVHHNVDEESAVKFWAKICDISQKHFCVTHQVSSASRGKRPRNSLPYGTLKLNVNGRGYFFKIKGWIDGLIKHS